MVRVTPQFLERSLRITAPFCSLARRTKLQQLFGYAILTISVGACMPSAGHEAAPPVSGSIASTSCVHTYTSSDEAEPSEAEATRAQAIVLPLDEAGSFGVRINTIPQTELSLHGDQAHFTLQPQGGAAAKADDRFSFDACIPYPLYNGPSRYVELPSDWLGFRFRWAGLRPGMYRITVNLGPGFAFDGDGKPVAIDKPFAKPSVSVYVPMASAEAASPTKGGLFVVLPALGGPAGTTFSDDRRAPIDVQSLAGRVLKLASITGPSLQFTSVDEPESITAARSGGPLPSEVYGLSADPTVWALRAKYVGHLVWGFGGLEFADGSAGSGSTRDPLTVAGIYRVEGYAAKIAVGLPQYWRDDRASAFIALDPILVVFRTPENITTPAGTAPTMRSAYALVSDGWDFERSYSLESIRGAHPEWSSATVEAIVDGKVELGMTKPMIAWMFGYPSIYGTVSSIEQLDTWTYDAPTPFQFTVHFRDGVVSKFDPPGTLP